MKILIITAAAIYLSSLTCTFAQINTVKYLPSKKYTGMDTLAKPPVLQFNKTFELEIDPIAYIFNGYSLHGSYNYNHFKYDVGVYGIQTPKALDNNKNFTTISSGFSAKVVYLFKKVNGFYVGVEADILQSNVTAKTSGQKDKGHSAGLGLDAGYRIFLFPNKKNALSGLYLTPWVGISGNKIYDKIKLTGYKENNISYFATVHIGYRF